MDELMAAMVLTSLSCSPLQCGPTHSQTAGTMTTNKQITTKLILRNNKRQPRAKTGTITTKTLQKTNNNLVVVGVRVVIK